MESPKGQPESYAAAWKTWKWRWLIAICLFLGYVPGAFALGLLFDWILQTEFAFYGVALLWMGAWTASWIWILLFRCPRCHNYYFYRYGRSAAKPFKLRCRYCSIPWGTLTDPGNLEQDLVRTTVETRRATKRSIIHTLVFAIVVMSAIAILGAVLTNGLAAARKTGDPFLSDLHAHQYAQAEALMAGASSNSRQIEAAQIQRLRTKWQSFEISRGKIGTPKFEVPLTYPWHHCTLAYALPLFGHTNGGAELDLVPENGEWRVKSLTLFNDSDQMFPKTPTPVPVVGPETPLPSPKATKN